MLNVVFRKNTFFPIFGRFLCLGYENDPIFHGDFIFGKIFLCLSVSHGDMGNLRFFDQQKIKKNPQIKKK